MITFEDFKKLDLRIAKILDVKEHPNADRLYVLQIDVGGETKQVVAGIRASYTPSDLLGKSVVIINNLEPATIRGEASNGMVLAASSEGGPIVLVPEKETSVGAKIS
ncbi:MAG: methionine--tRNA ligase subunit beta [Candidatus Omnitrophica bacterium]|nr:methionine--tRNA ligase subunit beta [Candidatus Omnitrophota bacterium]